VAVIVGVIVTAILDYFGLLTPQINTLLGVLAAIVTYFGYDGRLGRL
jgi:hypothetical protein